MEKGKINKEVKPPKRKKMALGRGLGALIPGTESSASQNVHQEYIQCSIDQIHPNKYQPRRKFSSDELEELSFSIKEQGIIQPLIVRQNSNGFELIAGERRLRAAKIAGLKKVPVVIKDISDDKLLEMSIVENIQRQDLNPLEEAEAYNRLMVEFDLTQEQVSERVGKSRPAVANFLRLRNLPDQIKESILDETISMGHAKVLLGADNPAQQVQIWQMIIAKKLSVRETERIMNRLKTEKKDSSNKELKSDEIYFSGIAESLSRRFGTKVQIKRRGRKGKLEIEFYNDDDLDRLIAILNN